jgi:uncharacterized protein YybS (DUF2232 family)
LRKWHFSGCLVVYSTKIFYFQFLLHFPRESLQYIISWVILRVL